MTLRELAKQLAVKRLKIEDFIEPKQRHLSQFRSRPCDTEQERERILIPISLYMRLPKDGWDHEPYQTHFMWYLTPERAKEALQVALDQWEKDGYPNEQETRPDFITL